ncbi:fumarylacetoacetate hydrolase family protein [Candidatus Solirubrobacter pratensis]|uniref:fumarylacetoacetate hydrolase family protein n=1 Tax=Candidatus Solirubrobacter pratensis TaxID=1298857 RepID=UPI00047F5F44|nr:fumarylacetoacetate hydrolase family protein [Candidatus Solirubrobacter pratensis]
MRWVRFDAGDGPRVGHLDDDEIQPVAAERLQDVIAGRGREAIGDRVPAAGLLAPLTPGKILAVGQNYLDHIREQGGEPPRLPVLFPKFPSSVIGPGEEIFWTDGLTEQVDYEAELAVVIGRRATRVTESDALEHVFGYTGANDVTARDLQFGDGQWTRGKGLDRFLPLGPIVVEAAEVPDPQDLDVWCRVNGATVQSSSTREMVFSVARIIAFISDAITLEPGDVILTGTPDGVGYFREPQLFLAPGDEVEVEIGDFGVLANPVGAPVAARERVR